MTARYAPGHKSELFDEAIRWGQALTPKAGATLGLIKAGLCRRPVATLRCGGAE
ncbi:hypothetical protein [Nocardia fusca]|uniref:Uncharacterized protein n=1 Tax=Nocardia fusca TaxID=941183 RepID=A0ABV3F8N1_9NOCA